MQRDAQIQVCAQSFLFPFCLAGQIGQLQGKPARPIDGRENEIQSIAPSVFGHDRFAKPRTQLSDRAEELIHEAWHLYFTEFAEAHRIGKKN